MPRARRFTFRTVLIFLLALTRTGVMLRSHFQSLESSSISGNSQPHEDYPWKLTKKTMENPEIGFCHGSCIAFGGKSTFWSGWSPQPNLNQMRHFPEDMLNTTMKPEFWSRATNLLNVTYAINGDCTEATKLQEKISKILRWPITTLPSVLTSEPAGMSLDVWDPASEVRFEKFSVPAPLLKIAKIQKKKADSDQGAPLYIVLDCAVETLASTTDGKVDRIDTSRGSLAMSRDKTKVILCAGVSAKIP